MMLNEFLVEAKVNTYASNGEGGERTLSDGCKELSYSNGEWKYQDRYYGSDPFIGEEIVWRSGEMVWGMNYYGKIVPGAINNGQIGSFLSFLKKSLSAVMPDKPFRGPKGFEESDWQYMSESSGTVDEFQGSESITFEGKKVYGLVYHGGRIARQ